MRSLGLKDIGPLRAPVRLVRIQAPIPQVRYRHLRVNKPHLQKIGPGHARMLAKLRMAVEPGSTPHRIGGRQRRVAAIRTPSPWRFKVQDDWPNNLFRAGLDACPLGGGPGSAKERQPGMQSR
jgi:hypothetical protein